MNAEIDDGTTLSDYMKLLTSSKVEENPRFPGTYSAVKYYKEGKGRSKMCKVVEEYAQEKVIEAEKRAEERVKETALSLIRDGVSDTIIHSAIKLPLEVIEELRGQAT